MAQFEALQLLLQAMLSTITVLDQYLRWRRLATKRLMRILSAENLNTSLGVLRVSKRRRQEQALLARHHWYAMSRTRIPRRWWVYPRSQDWWSNFVLNVWDNQVWIRKFHMTKQTMDYLVDALSERLDRQYMVMCEPIPTLKRVAMTVWWLANVASFREVSQQFAVGVSTVSMIVIEVCTAMELVLLHKTVFLGDSIKVILVTQFVQTSILFSGTYILFLFMILNLVGFYLLLRCITQKGMITWLACLNYQFKYNHLCAQLHAIDYVIGTVRLIFLLLYYR